MIQLQQQMESFYRELAEEFPRLQIVEKEKSWHQRLLATLLQLATLGTQNVYLTHVVTTFGTNRIYVPTQWPNWSEIDRWLILRHERVHLRQFRKYRFVGMALLYLLFPLPFGLAYFRYRFEQEAYEETIRASKEVYGLSYVQSPSFQEHIVSMFVSGAYGWMWPFPQSIRRWIQKVANEPTCE